MRYYFTTLLLLSIFSLNAQETAATALKKLILLFIVLGTCGVWAQNGHLIKTPTPKDGKISDEIFYGGLPKPKDSPYKYHIRYSKTSQTVDLYSNDGNHFIGKTLNYIYETDPKDHSISTNYIYQITAVNDSSASKLGRDIITNKLYLIPSDRLIKDYATDWLDCDGICYTYKIKDTIITACYTCPDQQTITNAELKIFEDYYHKTDSLLSTETSKSYFRKKLKKGHYYTDGFMDVIYSFTKKERYHQPEYIRRYLSTYKDTIDYCLQTIVKQKNFKSQYLYDHCVLIFSNTGKLEKIIDNCNFFNRITNHKRHLLRKKTRALFKDSDLKFLNLKYGFGRWLYFYENGEAYIEDNTIYPG